MYQVNLKLMYKSVHKGTYTLLSTLNWSRLQLWHWRTNSRTLYKLQRVFLERLCIKYGLVLTKKRRPHCFQCLTHPAGTIPQLWKWEWAQVYKGSFSPSELRFSADVPSRSSLVCTICIFRFARPANRLEVQYCICIAVTERQALSLVLVSNQIYWKTW